MTKPAGSITFQMLKDAINRYGEAAHTMDGAACDVMNILGKFIKDAEKLPLETEDIKELKDRIDHVNMLATNTFTQLKMKYHKHLRVGEVTA